jgi:hypothetical protein
MVHARTHPTVKAVLAVWVGEWDDGGGLRITRPGLEPGPLVAK